MTMHRSIHTGTHCRIIDCNLKISCCAKISVPEAKLVLPNIKTVFCALQCTVVYIVLVNIEFCYIIDDILDLIVSGQIGHYVVFLSVKKFARSSFINISACLFNLWNKLKGRWNL